MKWLRAVGSLALLLGVLVGVPFLLLTFTNPGALLQVQWSTALLRPDDGGILVELLGLVGWLAWLVLAATIVAEVLAVATRNRIDVHLPGTEWLRPAVTALVAAVMLVPSTAASAAPDAPAPPVTSGMSSTTQPGHGGSSGTASGVATSHEAQEKQQPRTGREYVVQPGDELWTVAQHQLGAGERWRDLLTVNPGLGANSRLAPGTTLQLPPDVQVREGDSLWKLAERHLGDGERWPEIYELNTDLISNPDQIDVGWRLLLPTHQQAPDSPKSDPPPQPPARGSTPDSAQSDPQPSTPEPRPATPTPQPTGGPAPSVTPSASPSPGNTAASVDVLDDDAEESGLDDHSAGLVGAVGGMLASTIVVGVAARRRLQLVGRAVGRRLIPISPEASRFWTALARRADEPPTPTERLAATSVVLGWRDDATDVVLDLETARGTGIVGASEPQAVIASMLTSLLCAPWSTEVEVVLVGADQPWAEAIDDPRLTQLSADEACAHITTLCATRRLELGARLLDDVRADPDEAPAWPPVVALFASPLNAAQAQTLDEALGLGRVGVSVVAPEWSRHTVVHFHDQAASFEGVSFHPQLLTTPARRALVELFAGTIDEATEAASWWSDEAPRRLAEGRFLQPEPEPIEHDAPSLILLGEPDIEGARGEQPRRARQQCIEYAAWLLLHPESTATSMSRGLCIAEGTRRSNLSRLRTWLGTDDEGRRYLPEAYQGRISLDKRVTSDWHRLRALLPGTINDAPDRALRQALTMVSDRPLGTAVERWPWARAFHDDMVAFLVDVACELADRCLASGYLDEARWALERGQLVAPGHDEIQIRTVRAHHLAGDAAATRQTIDAFVQTLREDNREMRREHATDLARIGREERLQVIGASGTN
ncbi:MAG: LysM peptidoglycan-binding domain-containing protein [Propionibacteriaceae bacterium]|nr:LysM peptidoglycan-binding domain-containing protein [Propionibacteriaceae bacterium]